MNFKRGLLFLGVVLILHLLYYGFYWWSFSHIESVKHADSFNSIYQLFARNDWGWYMRVATQGYSVAHSPGEIGCCDGVHFKQSEWAFFPLYPLLVRFTMLIFHLNSTMAAFWLSILLAWGALWVFYGCCMDLFGFQDKKAVMATLLFVLLPFNYYLHVYYTEALFFILVGGSFWAIKKKKLALMSLLVMMMVLTRPNGLVLLLPLFVFLVSLESDLKKNYKKLIAKCLWLLSGPMVFGLYCCYQYLMTGQFFAFSIAQRGWCRYLTLPYHAFFRDETWVCGFNSAYTLLVIGFWLYNLKKLTLPMNILVAVSILLPLCTGSVQSMARFIPLIFPLVVAFSEHFKPGWKNYTALVILFGLQLWSFYFWIVSDPMSY